MCEYKTEKFTIAHFYFRIVLKKHKHTKLLIQQSRMHVANLQFASYFVFMPFMLISFYFLDKSTLLHKKVSYAKLKQA